METLQFLKEYWFLITLGISVLTAIAYMVVFQVTPWDKYREISDRNKVIKLHIQLGQALLDAGYYEAAASEFEHSLKLLPSNHEALSGKRKTHLFLEFYDPDWKPGRAVAYLEVFKNQEDHNILLFMGMLHYQIGDADKAFEYFEKADAAFKRNDDSKGTGYYDALFNLGWLFYDKGDYDGMMNYFQKMKDAMPYDYRGYHGMGYALYMKAIDVSSSNCRDAIKLLNGAVDLLRKAYNYVPNIAVVNTDVGEIARVIDPDFSIFFHKRAMACISDDRLFSLRDNNGAVSAILILSGNEPVVLTEKEDKIAWINYLLALDYYVKAFLKSRDDPDLGRHDLYLKQAQSIEKARAPKMIYEDQKLVTDRLLKCIFSS
jgi:tetratricopeptide (TPR) repeat protein